MREINQSDVIKDQCSRVTQSVFSNRTVSDSYNDMSTMCKDTGASDYSRK